MKALALATVLIASAASAQSIFAPGSAPYPSPPVGRHFLDQPIATCVIATPVSVNAVMLTPCPAGSPPQPTQLPASAQPPVVTAPIAPTPEPKEPMVLRIEVVPVAPPKPAQQPAPKAVPKKGCPC